MLNAKLSLNRALLFQNYASIIGKSLTVCPIYAIQNVHVYNLLRGSLRQYSNCIQEKNSQRLSRAPVEGVRREATRVQFCSSYLPSF